MKKRWARGIVYLISQAAAAGMIRVGNTLPSNVRKEDRKLWSGLG